MANQSILTSTKKLLGIEEDYEQFDMDIIIYINSAFMSLNQLGLGPEDGFVIYSKSEEWTSFLDDRKDLEAVKSYVYLKTRLIFDPPQMGYLVEAINKQVSEIEWRLNVQVDPGTKSSNNGAAFDHAKLNNRSLPNQHPALAISFTDGSSLQAKYDSGQFGTVFDPTSIEQSIVEIENSFLDHADNETIHVTDEDQSKWNESVKTVSELSLNGRNLIPLTNQGPSNCRYLTLGGKSVISEYYTGGVNAARITLTFDDGIMPGTYTEAFIFGLSNFLKQIKQNQQYRVSFDLYSDKPIYTGLISIKNSDGTYPLTSNDEQFIYDTANRWTNISVVLKTAWYETANISKQVLYIDTGSLNVSRGLVIKNIELESALAWSPDPFDAQAMIKTLSNTGDQKILNARTQITLSDLRLEHLNLTETIKTEIAAIQELAINARNIANISAATAAAAGERAELGIRTADANTVEIATLREAIIALGGAVS